MPRWFWVLLGVLAAIALIIFIIVNVNVNVKGGSGPADSVYHGQTNYSVTLDG